MCALAIIVGVGVIFILMKAIAQAKTCPSLVDDNEHDDGETVSIITIVHIKPTLGLPKSKHILRELCFLSHLT